MLSTSDLEMEKGYYKVSAYNLNGESSSSIPVFAAPLTESIYSSPDITSIVQRSGYKIQLEWTYFSWASAYNIYRSTSRYGIYDYIGSTKYNYITFYLSFSDAGKDYFYKVSARDDEIESKLISSAYSSYIKILKE